MKKVVYCENCKSIIKRNGAFTAELSRRLKVGEIELPEMEQVVVKLCRPCAFKAGYKVKGENHADNG